MLHGHAATRYHMLFVILKTCSSVVLLAIFQVILTIANV